MRLILSQKSIYELNRLNNRMRTIGVRPRRLSEDDGMQHLIRSAASSHDLKVKSIFRAFLFSIEDENTARFITKLVPREDLMRVV